MFGNGLYLNGVELVIYYIKLLDVVYNVSYWVVEFSACMGMKSKLSVCICISCMWC